MYEATVLADSIAHGVRLTTLQVTFPRFILAQFNTHRMLSKNSASSRAVPLIKRIKEVTTNPFVPSVFTKNQSGMQAAEPVEDQAAARQAWLRSAQHAVECAASLADCGIHKQQAARVLEPYLWHTVIVTATEWNNFFALRLHEAAQPEMQQTAKVIKAATDYSVPVEMKEGMNQWHLPLVFQEDIEARLAEVPNGDLYGYLAKVSAGRCARVSYLTHDGRRDVNEDIKLAERLLQSGHMSPFEHQAMVKPCWPKTTQLSYLEDYWTIDLIDSAAVERSTSGTHFFHKNQYVCDFCNYPAFYGNFRSPWLQYRKTIPNEAIFMGGNNE